MAGQPDLNPPLPPAPAAGVLWKFDLAQVTAHESAGTPPAVVIDSAATTTFTLDSILTNVGLGSGPLIAGLGTTGTISYFATRIDATVPVVALTPTSFTMNASPFTVTSAAFGTAGPANANSLAPGVWNIVVLANFPGTAFAATVGGFNSIVLDIR
jgi:hypothetical protein